jgi:hypothetical protein
MNSNSHNRGILTLAYGKKNFIEQARSLAHSLQLHAPHLPRTLVTDSKDPGIRNLFTEVITYRPEYGTGVRQKMFLDQYSPYERTLFIDSDCLVLGNLDSFWSAFEGQHFGVPGFRYLQRGSKDPYMEVDYVLDKFNLTALPKFNGGTYYFSHSPEAARFFNTARNILENWRSLQLREFRRNGPGDESIYSLAMALHHFNPTSMGAGGMWTPVGYTGPLRLDVLGGTCSFEKEGMKLSPEIIHFPGEYGYAFPYARERAKLAAHVEKKKTSRFALPAALLTSALWQCSRKSAILAKLGRSSVRAFRLARARFVRV